MRLRPGVPNSPERSGNRRPTPDLASSPETRAVPGHLAEASERKRARLPSSHPTTAVSGAITLTSDDIEDVRDRHLSGRSPAGRHLRRHRSGVSAPITDHQRPARLDAGRKVSDLRAGPDPNAVHAEAIAFDVIRFVGRVLQTGRVTDAEFAIRSFCPTDWGAVCDVYEPAARMELTVTGTDPRAFRPLPDDEDLDTFLQLNSALVACWDGQVVGFVAWRDRGEWRNSGYLSFLYVDPAYHRRGIGDRLMRSAMVALGDQAWTLAKHGNDPAIRLYGRHGMQIVRERGAETCGYPYTEIRLAVPTSRRSDPDAPNFGV